MKTLHEGEFHGRARGRSSFQGLTLAESEYAPDHRLPLHAHENAFFSLLLRGTFDETLWRGGRRCVPTSLVFYPADEPHAEAFDGSGGRAFNIELGRSWMADLTDRDFRPPERSRETRAGPLNRLATRLYRDFVDGSGQVELSAEELVLEMVAELGRLDRLGDEGTAPPWLDRVRDQIHARFDEVIRVGELAEDAGVHPVHLARVFRRFHGCTVAEYQRQLRVERACALLTDPDVSLSGLALRTGFADQAHFSRRFKEVTGVTPGRYRSLVSRN